MSQRGRAKGASPWRHAGVPRISRRVWLSREPARLSGAPLIRATRLICTAVDYAPERHPTNIPTRSSVRGRRAPMAAAIQLHDITVHPAVEQQGAFFDVLDFFPTLTKELLEEN